jgi:hypothetical protein
MKKAKLASALVIGALTILTASPIVIAQSSSGTTAPQTSSPDTAVQAPLQTANIEHEIPYKIGGKVTSPRLISPVTTIEHPSAVPSGKKGYAIVSFVVSSTGVPNRIHIIRSGGAPNRMPRSSSESSSSIVSNQALETDSQSPSR